MNFNERLAYLGELLITLSGSPVPSHQFQALADYAHNVIPCDYLAICLIEPDQNGYRIHSLQGTAGGAIPSQPFTLEEGLVGHVLQRNRSVIATNLATDNRGSADVEGVASRLGLCSALVTPLRQGDTALGAIYFASCQSDVYGHEELQLADLLSSGLSASLETTRLYQALLDERSTLAAVLSSSRDAVLVVNPQGTILLANPAVSDMLGLDAAAITGQSLYEAVDNPAVHHLFNRAEPGIVELQLVNGRTTQASLTPVTTAFGERVGWAATFRDITVLKQLEQMKNEFVSIVSHDLKNPISSITLAANLLAKAGELNQEQEEIRRRLLETAEYMNELVSDLLDLGKIEAGLDMKREPFDLSRQVVDVMEQLLPQIEARQQELRLSIPEEVTAVGHPDRIKQALLNLVGNAIKYTPPKGRIEIMVAEAPASQYPQAAAATSDRLIVVRVTDNGIGIPADSLPFLFDKFYRVRNAQTESIQGTGLGLAITRSIIETHDGRIWVESVEGQGSSFVFYLPILPPET
jgi:two-component system, OmpR family, phosphate regulon sensor histidine kinase PhoR